MDTTDPSIISKLQSAFNTFDAVVADLNVDAEKKTYYPTIRLLDAYCKMIAVQLANLAKIESPAVPATSPQSIAAIKNSSI